MDSPRPRLRLEQQGGGSRPSAGHKGWTTPIPPTQESGTPAPRAAPTDKRRARLWPGSSLAVGGSQAAVNRPQIRGQVPVGRRLRPATWERSVDGPGLERCDAEVVDLELGGAKQLV